jgi:acetyltransferase-like isoleucine patch superfamily enzyme
MNSPTGITDQPNTQMRSHLKQTLGARFRRFYYRSRVGAMGREVFIDRDVQLLRYLERIFLEDGVVIKSGAHLCPCNAAAMIRVGARTTIGHYVFLYASESIEIGPDCMIAPFAYLVDSDHGIRRNAPMNRQLNETAPIRIGQDVWIGTGANILKGVTIAEGAVVAAGAVVKDDVAPYHIVGGVPARVLGERS